ncbi:MAG TPA: ABC-type transport auxiliary lipoprotein family protein, partial [Gallionella sp.]|nr:ABC-type transport auxiliary lipoprotein family protein [Gallionella sp.]
PKVESQKTYLLEARPLVQAAGIRRDLVLAVNLPHALPGFDTRGMAYVQQAHELNYFASSRWADTPARMLEPLLLQAIEQTGSFRAVVRAVGAVPADIRLDTELMQLQQDFEVQPSRIQLTLRAQLLNVKEKRVLAVREFAEVENADSEDPYGGVAAANRALQRALGKVAEFCVSESGGR